MSWSLATEKSSERSAERILNVLKMLIGRTCPAARTTRPAFQPSVSKNLQVTFLCERGRDEANEACPLVVRQL